MTLLATPSPVLSPPTLSVTKSEVSLLRLYALRATYLLIAVGLGSEIWPAILHHRPWDLWHGVGCCLLGAVAVLAVLGLRHPLKMLPLLLFEMVWKSTWLIAIALPGWRAGQMDEGVRQTAAACLMGVIFPIVIPWPYLVRAWVTAPGDRWR
jgi:hypothetical protein